MRLLVCGGRHYANYKYVKAGKITQLQFLEEYLVVDNAIANALGWITTEEMDSWLPPAGTVIVSGAADGVDTSAIDWAVTNWVQFEEYPADWDKHGKAAGPIRNQQMLVEGKPDKVLAIHGGKGTADMVFRARKAGIPVIEVT